MSAETEKTHDFEWTRIVQDSSRLPQLGVHPDLLIKIAARKPVETSPKSEQPKDTLKWGFFFALDAFLQKKL